MSKKYSGNTAAVDRTIAAAIQALDAYKDPDPREAFRQIGYVMRTLHQWARDRERERMRALCQAETAGKAQLQLRVAPPPKPAAKAPF